MVRHWIRLALATFLATGGWSACLLDTGTINKRPSVQIHEHEILHRGERVTFAATISDANDKLDALKVEWLVREGDTCAKASNESPLSCDSASRTECLYTVPAGMKSNSLCLVVQVTDQYSASASASRVFFIENRPPVAVIKLLEPATSASDYPLGTGFKLSGTDSRDPDPDDTGHLLYSWTVTRAGQELSSSTCSKESQCTFTAAEPGRYTVSLTVKDPSQATSEAASETLEVDDDSPPCISRYNPEFLHPVRFAAQVNTFSVEAVRDDLDAYPDPGTGTFTWSYRKGTAGSFTRYGIPSTSSQLSFKENSFSVGEQMQFRVEYQDRQTERLSCAPDVECCSLDKDDCKCAQWITWTVTFQ